jgi:HAD superfamily hydrolase (TIGR01509 family)
MPHIQTVIFDMDGLLVDSEPLARRSWQQVLHSYGLLLDDETYGRMIGLRLEESSRLLQSRLGVPAPAEELASRKEAILARLGTEGIPSMPGLNRLMVALRERRLPWAVATSNRRPFAVQVLQQLDLWSACHSLTTGEEVANGKPAPDIYLLAAQRMGVAPARCLALEDSVPGAQAAKAAGMVTIAVPGPHETASAFHFVDYVYDTLGDVAQDLDELLSDRQSPGERQSPGD